MDAKPPVSIGLPVRNGERHLPEALSDLLDQSFGDFELLISDNASDDATEEICREAARDARVRYIRQHDNIGAAANYNFVFHSTTGTYFRWASHDDRCRSTHLESCLHAFKTNPDDVVLVYPKTLLIDDRGDELGPYDDRLQMDQADARHRLVVLARNWRLCNPVMGLVHRPAAERTRLIDTFRGSDIVYLAELAIQGRVIEVPERLFLRRIHSGSALQGNSTDTASWLDPTNRPRRESSSHSTLPILRHLIRSVHDGPEGLGERLTTEMSVASTWLMRRARVNAGRIRGELRTRL